MLQILRHQVPVLAAWTLNTSYLITACLRGQQLSSLRVYVDWGYSIIETCRCILSCWIIAWGRHVAEILVYSGNMAPTCWNVMFPTIHTARGGVVENPILHHIFLKDEGEFQRAWREGDTMYTYKRYQRYTCVCVFMIIRRLRYGYLSSHNGNWKATASSYSQPMSSLGPTRRKMFPDHCISVHMQQYSYSTPTPF